MEEKLRKKLSEDGLTPVPASPFGFRPVNEWSLSAPTGEVGASIVDAARGLRARKRGEIAMYDGVQSPRAKELLAKSEAARSQAAQDDHK
jgi:hypothetical protein